MLFRSLLVLRLAVVYKLVCDNLSNSNVWVGTLLTQRYSAFRHASGRSVGLVSEQGYDALLQPVRNRFAVRHGLCGELPRLGREE